MIVGGCGDPVAPLRGGEPLRPSGLLVSGLLVCNLFFGWTDEGDGVTLGAVCDECDLCDEATFFSDGPLTLDGTKDFTFDSLGFGCPEVSCMGLVSPGACVPPHTLQVLHLQYEHTLLAFSGLQKAPHMVKVVSPGREEVQSCLPEFITGTASSTLARIRLMKSNRIASPRTGLVRIRRADAGDAKIVSGSLGPQIDL